MTFDSSFWTTCDDCFWKISISHHSIYIFPNFYGCLNVALFNLHTFHFIWDNLFKAFYAWFKLGHIWFWTFSKFDLNFLVFDLNIFIFDLIYFKFNANTFNIFRLISHLIFEIDFQIDLIFFTIDLKINEICLNFSYFV